mgnify:CR=1 FL=1
MQSTNPHPEEPDLSYICGTYIVECDEFPGIYKFMQYLDKLRYCEYSDTAQDWFTFHNDIIQSHWVIFVSCLPKDMDRLRYVANRMRYDISVIDNSSDEADDLLPFI